MQYQIGSWQVNPDMGVLCNEDKEPHLTPHEMDVLVFLATRPNEVVSIEEILQAVWPDTVTGDYTVYNTISNLRKVLNEDSGEVNYIDTIPKKGYRLVASVTHLPQSSAEDESNDLGISGDRDDRKSSLKKVALTLAIVLLIVAELVSVETIVDDTMDTAIVDQRAASDLPPANSIAVLPLLNSSPDPNNAYFAAGVHEEILNKLAKIRDLQLTSRTTVLLYQDSDMSAPDIARELNVSNIMEGSVRFADNQVRITIQLIRASDDVHIWSETYQSEYEDIFDIQADVAVQIVKAMQATISPDELASVNQPVSNSFEAYTLYLESRYQLFDRLKDDHDGQISKLERAVELDPLFARGFAELAERNRYKSQFVLAEERSELLGKAIFYANRAIELDPTFGDGYSVLAQVSFQRKQWNEWQHYIRKSVELPDVDGTAARILAEHLSVLQYYQESYQWFDVAISKNPSNLVTRHIAIIARIDGRDYETALSMIEEFRTSGADENAYQILRAYTLNQLDRKSESFAARNKLTKNPLEAIAALGLKTSFGYLDYLRCQSDEYGSVRIELEELPFTMAAGVRILSCAAGAGDLDTFFATFQAISNLGLITGTGPNSPMFDSARKDPRLPAADHPELSYIPLPKSR